jgi:predicted alpha/beta-hydrolase family hydrolase
MSPVPLRVALPDGSAVTAAVHGDARRLLVFAHGAGAGMDHPLVAGFAARLAARDVTVATFNFPFAESLRRRPPDPPARLDAAYAAVVGAVREQLPGRALVLGGRSLGGRVAGRVATRVPCHGVVLVSYPLRAAHRPDAPLRTDWWPALDVPALFVSGDRDRLCDLALLERERGALRSSEVRAVAGGTHDFAGPRRDALLSQAADAVAAWLGRLPLTVPS